MTKPEELLKVWMAAVNGGDIENVLALYDQKAILIPTFSNRLLSTPGNIREYFEKLGSREDLSVALHEKTLLVQAIKDEMCTLNGIYCWRFTVDGELLSFEARFSFVLDLAHPAPIIQHHSSQIPRIL